MTLQIAPLTSFILSLAWQGDPGMTYTIQTSADLIDWNTIPYVVEGSGQKETYYLDRIASLQFARLQFDSDGDANNNALPDLWEWEYFGYLGVDPNDDPDLDGESTYTEWIQQTNPLDYYNDEWPIIHVASGREWLVPSGSVSTQAVALYVQNPSGEPWRNAPIHLSMESGNEGLVIIDSESDHIAASMVLWTDEMGRLDPAMESVHVLASDVPDTLDQLMIRAGQSTAGIVIHAIGGEFGPPPRNLNRYIDSDGQRIYSWSGDPGSADSFSIQEMDASGQWVPVIEIATADLTPPDPVDGSYTLILQN